MLFFKPSGLYKKDDVENQVALYLHEKFNCLVSCIQKGFFHPPEDFRAFNSEWQVKEREKIFNTGKFEDLAMYNYMNEYKIAKENVGKAVLDAAVVSDMFWCQFCKILVTESEKTHFKKKHLDSELYYFCGVEGHTPFVKSGFFINHMEKRHQEDFEGQEFKDPQNYFQSSTGLSIKATIQDIGAKKRGQQKIKYAKRVVKKKALLDLENKQIAPKKSKKSKEVNNVKRRSQRHKPNSCKRRKVQSSVISDHYHYKLEQFVDAQNVDED